MHLSVMLKCIFLEKIMDKNKFNKFIKNNIDDDFWNNYIELVKKQAKLYRKSAKVKMLKYTLLINGNIKKVSATIIHF